MLSPLNRKYILMAFFITTHAMAADLTCPKEFDGKPLTNIGVYDGPVSEMADLIPLNGGWDIDRKPTSTDGFFLGCSYGKERGREKIISFHIPPTAKSCMFTDDDNAICSEKTCDLTDKANPVCR
jgi:hypothetical protein